MQFKRRSDRIALYVPVEVSSTDAPDKPFTERTVTLSIDRHGARTVLTHRLNARQQVKLKCIGTGTEAAARVARQLGESPQGFEYGVELADPTVDLWGIKFPALTGSERAAGRVLLECSVCGDCEVGYLDIDLLKTFKEASSLSRKCQRCNQVTTWGRATLRKLLGGPAAASEAGQAGVAQAGELSRLKTKDQRADPRKPLSVPACIKSAQHGDDIVLTHDVSEGGASFRSLNNYARGDKVEIAIPFFPATANVLASAQIAWRLMAQPGPVKTYGVSCLRQRRREPRIKATLSVPVGFTGGSTTATGQVVDLSARDILVKCSKPVEVGTHVRLGIEAGSEMIRTMAVARRSVSGVGSAFEFVQMSQRDRMLLRQLLSRLDKQTKS